MEDIVRDLTKGNALTRERAANIASHLDNPSDEVLNALRANIAHVDWHVRRASALALGALERETALPDIEPLTKDRAFGVRTDVGKLIDELRQNQQHKEP